MSGGWASAGQGFATSVTGPPDKRTPDIDALPAKGFIINLRETESVISYCHCSVGFPHPGCVGAPDVISRWTERTGSVRHEDMLDGSDVAIPCTSRRKQADN
jgi:hypothetical protein